jgi:D-glycero-D-manno-heptose 1,7-bisphosphate phosphatase
VAAEARPAVFLDRDGVINEATVRDGKPYPPRDLSELKIIDGVPEALARLKGCGFDLLVVTNQPDIARGNTDASDVAAIHDALREALPLDAIYICPHDDTDGCDCRKPKTGMIDRAAQERNIDLRRSVVVGDRWRDIEMGQSAGLSTVFIKYGYDERQPSSCDRSVEHLGDAVEWMCNLLSK